jgi:hypothetical protein
MHDDTLLIAIDDALGASSLCACGHELVLAERDDTLWLECPEFTSSSRLPARLAAFLHDASHDRRPVAALPSRPAADPGVPGAPRPVPAARPVAVRG